ncbi:Do family serine endopeptidase [Sneathiella glossodoripedis]|uniref:Do family serine endopeptidase n=1 Tax=Sneathiella glossodoripedis TaxID=418853 RepID=UPI000A473038|nr:Do family serine endopeptidase [Sneathiella glossodoripedis]
MITAQERVIVPESQLEVRLSYAPLVKKAAPAVVNIFTKKEVRQRSRPSLFNDPFFEQFFGPGFRQPKKRKKVQNSLGSGVIVKGDGVIVTNYHVIAGADEITVALNDRREFEARVLLVDESTDLAVLKIETDGESLTYLEFEDSDALEVGDLVIAIGNPFGVGQSVTSGIISALGRTTGATADIESFIQTDAAINPGNSGGALLTMRGTLAGINSAIFSKGGGSLGIGFAIPANLVKSVMLNGLDTGKVIRPWLGAQAQSLTADMARSLGFDRPIGVLISEVARNSAAYKAGLKPNDIILSVDGYDIIDERALNFRISTGIVGETANLKILRGEGEIEITLKHEAAPEIPQRDLTLLEGAQPLVGAIVGNLSPAFALELGISPFIEGVVIAQISPENLFARQRFRPGDIIVSVNGEEVTSPKHLQRLMIEAEGGWDILFRRGDQLLRLRRSR